MKRRFVTEIKKALAKFTRHNDRSCSGIHILPFAKYAGEICGIATGPIISALYCGLIGGLHV